MMNRKCMGFCLVAALLLPCCTRRMLRASEIEPAVIIVTTDYENVVAKLTAIDPSLIPENQPKLLKLAQELRETVKMAGEDK